MKIKKVLASVDNISDTKLEYIRAKLTDRNCDMEDEYDIIYNLQDMGYKRSDASKISKKLQSQCINCAVDMGIEHWYKLKHGWGPGTIPNDVAVLDHIVDGYNDYVKLDKTLTTQELYDYDIAEEAPKHVYDKLDDETIHTIVQEEAEKDYAYGDMKSEKEFSRVLRRYDYNHNLSDDELYAHYTWAWNELDKANKADGELETVESSENISADPSFDVFALVNYDLDDDRTSIECKFFADNLEDAKAQYDKCVADYPELSEAGAFDTLSVLPYSNVSSFDSEVDLNNPESPDNNVYVDLDAYVAQMDNAFKSWNEGENQSIPFMASTTVIGSTYRSDLEELDSDVDEINLIFDTDVTVDQNKDICLELEDISDEDLIENLNEDKILETYHGDKLIRGESYNMLYLDKVSDCVREGLCDELYAQNLESGVYHISGKISVEYNINFLHIEPEIWGIHPKVYELTINKIS